MTTCHYMYCLLPTLEYYRLNLIHCISGVWFDLVHTYLYSRVHPSCFWTLHLIKKAEAQKTTSRTGLTLPAPLESKQNYNCAPIYSTPMYLQDTCTYVMLCMYAFYHQKANDGILVTIKDMTLMILTWTHLDCTWKLSRRNAMPPRKGPNISI